MNRINTHGKPSRSTAAIAILFFACVLLLISPSTRSQTPAGGPNSLKSEIQPLAFFLGEWNCAGEFIASKKPIASHIAIAPDLDGSMISFRWDDKEPNRFHALELWGFDKTANHFTNFIHDNFGGARLFTSSGWDGDTLIWLGDMLTTPAAPAQRFVIDKKSAKAFVITWEVRKGDSPWAAGDRLTCQQ